MATNFPTSLDALTNPAATDSMANVDHASQHINANDSIEALEAKVGADSSAVTSSHDYKLSGVTGSDKASSVAGTETLANKTIDTANNTLTVAKTDVAGAPTGDFVGSTDTQTLTNKTLDGNNNTVTVLAASQLSGVTPLANGGTGQSTQTAAMDALSPTTTKGDLVVDDGTNVVRLPVGANNQVLAANSAVSAGVEWQTSSAAGSLVTSSGSTATVANTVTETTILTATIPGNTIGTTGALRLDAHFNAIGLSANEDVTLRVKFGGTTVGSITLDNNASILSTQELRLVANIVANGSTSAQKSNTTIVSSLLHGANINSITAFASGSSSIDVTSSADITVSVEFTNASASDTVTLNSHFVEQIIA